VRNKNPNLFFEILDPLISALRAVKLDHLPHRPPLSRPLLMWEAFPRLTVRNSFACSRIDGTPFCLLFS